MAPTRTGQPARGYHEGELMVQRRAGVSAQATQLVRMLDPTELSAGAARFLEGRRLAVMTARDVDGTLWTSPLTGPAGLFRVVDPATLRVTTAPAPGDPLHGLPAGQPVGLIAIDPATRRRYRVNGHLTVAGRGSLTIEVEQAYGNCPQYIQLRDLSATPGVTRDATPSRTATSRRSTRLDAEDVAQVSAADTFFIGSTHPSRGNDASHRGGPSGFVRVEDDRTLWWPDYPGNSMFNTLGNLAVDPTAALLLSDFTTGRTLHLTGRAVLETTLPGAAGDDGGTGRRVRFLLDAAVVGAVMPLRADEVVAHPRNPRLSD